MVFPSILVTGWTTLLDFSNVKPALHPKDTNFDMINDLF